MRLTKVFLLFFLFLSSCATSLLGRYEEIQIGDDKSKVLEKMGAPKRSMRFAGKDRWTYVFEQSGKLHEKEIHFENSQVIYKGDRDMKKELERVIRKDNENEKSNAELEKQVAEEKKAAKAALENFQTHRKGKSKDVIYAPDYKPAD